MINKDKVEFRKDIRYILFRYYTLIVALLAGLFTVINYLNKRPVVNIVTGLGVGLFCLLIYFRLSYPLQHYFYEPYFLHVLRPMY